MFAFQKRYLILTIFLLLVEVLIALFINDTFVRPYIGDLLVVVLLYCFLRTFINLPALAIALMALLFAYFIETLQYVDFISSSGLQNSRLARILLGNSFDWGDMLAYTLGIISVIAIERIFEKKEAGKIEVV